MKRIEQETVINYNAEEDFAIVSTRQKSEITRLKKRGAEQILNQGDYVRFRVPKKWAFPRPPRKTSEKQREAAYKNVIQARNARKSLGCTKGTKTILTDR